MLALLDTGADYCCFPKNIVESTGSVLKSGVKSELDGLGGLTDAWSHKFNLSILSSDGATVIFKKKEIDVKCVETENLPPIIGIMDFLIDLKIIFNFSTKKFLIYTP